MASSSDPVLSTSSKKFLTALTRASSENPVSLQLSEFYDAENDLRRKFAAKEAASDLYANLVPVFHSKVVSMGANKTKSRVVDEISVDKQYICPLGKEKRRSDGDDSFVQDGLDGFKRNWDTFTEGALSMLNWENVFVAGGAVLACLQPLPPKVLKSGAKGPSPRALREYFHNQAYPASDIDLFLYGLKDEEAAKDKMLEIYESIKACARADVTCIRSTHAVTIVCEHIQIILRLYSSPSEILAGFDVDACAVGYNGSHVFAVPRAFVSLVTQTVTVDTSRRSPSYELRLAKYAQRGFEIFVPDLKREIIDPTIFDRSPTRLQGLARLLVLTVINTDVARNSYLEMRRQKRSRPPHPEATQARTRRRRNFKRGDLKAAEMDGLFESNYDSIHIPYGKRFTAKNIERLMFQRDMVYNAEWNPKNCPPQREWKLHRHPCFFGDMGDIFEDCCGYCPEPESAEAVALQKEEDERFVRGVIRFMVDDPGRQSIGSFHPITDGDWAEMAYLSQEALLASSVAQNRVKEVSKLLKTSDVNKRDHTGRTLLFLATQCGNVDVARVLVENGARLTARNFDGRTVLHLACQMGNHDLVDMFLRKSKENAQQKELREQGKQAHATDEDSGDSEDGFEKIKRSEVHELDEYADIEEEDILNLDLPDWDYCFTPLHHAIYSGHVNLVQRLIDEGADITIPVKIPRVPECARWQIQKQTFFPIVLCAATPNGLAIAQLLLREGVSSQSDSTSTTALHMLICTKRIDLIKFLLEQDPKAKAVLNHLTKMAPPLLPIHTAIFNKDHEMTQLLLGQGAKAHISREDFLEFSDSLNAWWLRNYRDDERQILCYYGQDLLQPVEMAIRERDVAMVKLLLEQGGTVDSGPKMFFLGCHYGEAEGMSFLDVVNDRITLLKSALSGFDSSESKLEPSGNIAQSDGATFLSWIEGEWRRSSATLKEEDENENEYSGSEDSEEGEGADQKGNSTAGSKSPAEQKRHAEEAKVAKKAALEKQLSEFQELQAIFVAKNAKTWNELPGYDLLRMKEASHLKGIKTLAEDEKPAFSEQMIEFKYTHWSNVPQTKHEGYLELFEAVWAGDVQGIKQHTLTKWGPENKNEPLKVAVHESLFGNTLVMIALRRKQYDLARILLQIAQAQYRPKDEKTNYYVDRDNSDSDSESEAGNSDYYVAEETVDNTFELGDVTHIPDEARSDVTALKILRRPAKLGPYTDAKLIEKLKESNLDVSSGTALTAAVLDDDYEAFVKILDLANEVDPDGADRLLMPYEGYGSLDLPSGRCTDFKLALNLGRISFIEEIIRRSAWGIDFDQLEAQLDAAYHEDPTSNVNPPRFYSGLRVRGKYRRDWAKATAPSQDSPFHSTKIPVGMLAAYYGNPQTIEWLFGNGPANAVDEFIKSHKSDKRVELLEKSGWREHLTDWFGLRCTPARDNAFHAAIIGGKIEGIESVFKTFVQHGVAPLTILQSKQRSPKHDSLLISARLPHAHLKNIFERYAKYGGDPTVTDKYGYNILHILAFTRNDVDLRFCLRQLSPEQKNTMLTSRVARTLHTPIALAVRSHRLDIVEIFLEHGTAQLCLRDGDGNLPIHIASGNGLARITAALIEAYPSGLLVEDTSGSLPIEIAEQRCLISNTQTDPFAFVYKASIEAQSRQNWVYDRPELQAPKIFMDQTLDKQVLEKTDVNATLEVIKKAMETVAISERKLVSLIDVSDVVRRATKRLTDSKREYSPGDHFTSRDSLWQMKEDKENTED